MPPSTPKRKQLTRDERLRIQTLREAGWKTDMIHAHLRPTINNLSLRQVEYACLFTHPTPHKRSGRPGLLNKDQETELIAFVRTSKVSRRLTYLELAIHFDWGFIAVQGCLERAGYRRYVARVKPPISEKNRLARIDWAEEHKTWTKEQWRGILWTDETWVTGERHTKTWITRLPGEELDPTCIVEKVSKPKGWMFWDCFHGFEKGPGLFWEKKWGSINRLTYCEHIVSSIASSSPREHNELTSSKGTINP
jgi:Transposase